ncbi:MAG: hypothetical protein JW940_24335 [Polyangiaceae bacterium]|nr:hypothetical protein [Polyangiaceae bacterium]
MGGSGREHVAAGLGDDRWIDWKQALMSVQPTTMIRLAQDEASENVQHVRRDMPARGRVSNDFAGGEPLVRTTGPWIVT